MVLTPLNKHSRKIPELLNKSTSVRQKLPSSAQPLITAALFVPEGVNGGSYFLTVVLLFGLFFGAQKKGNLLPISGLFGKVEGRRRKKNKRQMTKQTKKRMRKKKSAALKQLTINQTSPQRPQTTDGEKTAHTLRSS